MKKVFRTIMTFFVICIVIVASNFFIKGVPLFGVPDAENIEQIVKAVNYAYKVSKSNFIWEEKVKSSKKNVQAQLDGVSKAISSIAVKMEEEIKQDKNFEE